MQVTNNTNLNSYNSSPENRQPTFKAGLGGVLNASGGLMQGIENGGFLASFLIQDTIGMTVPRTYAGFLRDKEITGEYNIQEGMEVLGREGLTGPCMMAVAPIMLMLAAKCGRSTSVNSSLIKRFGNSLKVFINSPSFDKNLLKDANKFKEEFYKINLEKMLSNSLGKENFSKESVEYILKELKNFEKIPQGQKLHWFRGKSKYRQERMNNIIEHINNIKYKTNTDLDMLGKLKVGIGKNVKTYKTYKTSDAIEAMIKYTDDAIVANKNLAKLDAINAEKIMNKSIAKRIITNVSTIFATLGVLSVLPKIYARSDTAPGARAKLECRKQVNNNENISFKSKNNLLEKLGKKVASSKKYDKLSSELEYNGHNFTNSLMAGLSLFGLLAPRGWRAFNRAEVDENGKKDLTEIWEILIRDVTSSLAVVFAVPMLTRACVTGYEKKSGFVLMNKDRTLNKTKTILDLFNPYSKAHVLTNSEISALYDNIDSHKKMVNFCEYIDKNGGDLHKILSKSDDAKNLVNLDDLKGLNKQEKNSKIKNIIKQLGNKTNDQKSLDELVKKVMKGASGAKNNKIASFARGLNSVPGLLTTFFISPYILGWLIPRLTYKNTQRIHAKQDKEKELQNKLTASV